MYMPVLTKCCFCVPLRFGLLTWAYIRLVFNIFAAACALITISGVEILLFYNKLTICILIIILSSFVLLTFDIVFNFVLIVGCHKKHTTLLRIYFRFGIAYTVAFVMLYVTNIAFDFATDGQSFNLAANTWDFIPVFSSVCGMLLILHVYLLLMVNSEISRLKQPTSQLQFVNRIAVPSRIKQVDSLPTNNKRVISSEKPSPSALASSKNDWLYIDNKNFSI